MALNDTRIRNAKPKAKPYKLSDEKGLFLEVRPTGAKIWRYRYRLHGLKADTRDRIVEHLYTIGEYLQTTAPDHVSLDDARARRIAARALVKAGIHPKSREDTTRAEQRAAHADTFRGAAAEWVERNGSKWTEKYRKLVTGSLDTYVFPRIGDMPLRSIRAPHIKEVVQAVADKGHAVTAINLRQWCGAIFSDAELDGRVDSNPTIAMRGRVDRPKPKHKKPLTKDGIRDLRKKIADSTIAPQTRLAFEILLFTFVRPGELRRGEWKEVDLDRSVWTIPAEKMKKRDPHVVPLSTQAVALFRALHAVTGGQRWLLPSVGSDAEAACMNEATLNHALRRFGYAGGFTAHGFRATASTELHELGYRTELIEFQLSHADRDETRASYNFAQWMQERRAMVQQWADMVDAWTAGADVTPIGKAA